MVEILTWARYAVRASGLVLVVIIAASVGVMAIMSQERSAVPALACCWITAAAVLSWPRMPKSWRRDPPTDRQLEYARSLGINAPEGISKGELSDLISAAAGR